MMKENTDLVGILALLEDISRRDLHHCGDYRRSKLLSVMYLITSTLMGDSFFSSLGLTNRQEELKGGTLIKPKRPRLSPDFAVRLERLTKKVINLTI